MAPGPSRSAVQGEPDVDPDFLALPERQRRAIDRAFERGIGRSTSGGRKRRKVAPRVKDAAATSSGGGGGFVEDDAGGFVAEDDAGGFAPDDGGGFFPDDAVGEGGFLPDDTGGFGSEPRDSGAGGFLPGEADVPAPTGQSTPNSTSTSNAKLPLYLLPSLLTSLGLPSDEDVLQVFRASASGWAEDDEPPRRRKRPGAEEQREGGVELKDFRAVCAALMGPDEGGEDLDINVDAEVDVGMEVDMEGDQQDDGEEAFDSPTDDDESSLSDLSDYSEFDDGGNGKGRARGTGKSKGKSKGKGRAVLGGGEGDGLGSPQTSRRRGKKALEATLGPAKLSSRQREMVKDIWEMVKPPSKGGARPSWVLGRDEVKGLVRSLGEMWTDEEITDMVSLFSSQHEGRGLSFDDFGGVMLRAGLI